MQLFLFVAGWLLIADGVLAAVFSATGYVLAVLCVGFGLTTLAIARLIKIMETELARSAAAERDAAYDASESGRRWAELAKH